MIQKKLLLQSVYFCGFYRVNSSESLTNCVKPKGLYVKFVNDSPEFAHRKNPQK